MFKKSVKNRRRKIMSKFRNIVLKKFGNLRVFSILSHSSFGSNENKWKKK